MKSQVGTENYTAPEMIRQRPYTIKADIWSVGCVIYGLCAYRAPFEAADGLETMRKIVEEAPPRIPNEYSIDLFNIIL